MAQYSSYIICTSPRSGSTLLCELLAATGKSGHPDSHFHNPSLADWLKAFALSDAEFKRESDALKAVFDAARVRGTGDTGLFGLRLQRRSFDFFMQKLNVLHPGLANDRHRIEAAFGSTRFIHLTRSSKLEQAISFVKAQQTGLWHIAPDGRELERLSPPREPVFDTAAISRQIAEFTTMDMEWDHWFDGQGISPLYITYDDLSSDPAGVLALVLRQLGLDPEMAHGISPPVAKLADATNREWARRFLRQDRG